MSEMTRLDLRIPNDLLDRVRIIASERFMAKINHISKQPEVTPTVIQLIQYGIEYLDSLPYDFTLQINPDSLPDSYLDKILERVSGKIDLAITDSPAIEELRERVSRLELTTSPTMALMSPTKTEVLNHTDILSSDVEQKGGLEANDDDSPLTDSKSGSDTLEEKRSRIRAKAVKGEGISSTELATLLGVRPPVICRWAKKISEGNVRPPTSKNRRVWVEFVQWDRADELWYRKNTQCWDPHWPVNGSEAPMSFPRSNGVVDGALD